MTADWPALAAGDFALPAGVCAEELLPEAFQLLTSPHPEQRDGLAYPALATWVMSGELDGRLTEVAAQTLPLLTAPHTHSRTFAPLILAVLLSRDAQTRELDPATVRSWLEAWATWYTSEPDLRSYDPQVGWLHAVAHGADVAASFAEHPSLERADLRRVLDTLSQRIRQVDQALLQQEDDRLALAAFVLLARPELTPADRRQWLADLGRLMQPEQMPRSASAAFAVQVGRALLLFTQFGVGGEGGAPVPARSADGWREDLLAALHRTFPVYGDPAAS
ncbi:DUF2785 domain-containing protein [Deinococcus radiophilus]|uniref:DUF2785 domain-containing protein n=1 Tax=Deinococcus radiophilus TaxID=32062 RepID=A0A3S0K9I1_9DEIO|nr:DUF2785 domain-containing protein [Deinococcus radiophilus]RTR25661.1 DUF2785 domain-containing protein [Deinococcus radiophilus]UFA50908.1 DUF2785 domain-containing protein [Deinococcus radiophilus]